ncbi:MAG: AI-2E family transporter [Sphingobacteriales bacterium]|nr:AI-2E family transporter [Sphingobacteriales bacterium]
MNIIDTSKPFTFDRTVRIIITALIIYSIIWVLGYLSDVLTPFAIAVIIAYLLNPFTTWVQKYVKIRVLAVLITFIVVISFITALLWLIIPIVSKEVRMMVDLVYNYLYDIDFQKKVSEQIPAPIYKLFEESLNTDKLKEILSDKKLSDNIIPLLQKILPGIWGIITSTATIFASLAGFVIVFLYLVFVLKDYEKFRTGWQELIPERFRSHMIGFVRDFESIMSKYFRNQALIAFIVGILFSIGFVIIKLPLGIILGLFIGLLNMVPYLQTIGIIPCAFSVLLYTLSGDGNIWIMTGKVTAVFVITQSIQDYILTPKIMGKVTGFNPAIIVLSLTIWGKLLGFLGLVIALPLTYLILAYYKRFILNEQIEQSPVETESPGV